MSEAETNIYGQLAAVQHDLKAPKNQKNTFGGYDYRSAEDILEAVKPLLNEHGLTLTVSDAIELIGDRYYVMATATVLNGNGDFIDATAYAREADDKKGMDSAQVTGSTSSYARKYALNGLFAIDDSKDVDSDEHRRQSDSRESQTTNRPKASPNKPASEKQIGLIRTLSGRLGLSDEALEARLVLIKTSADASDAIDKLNKLVEEERV